MEFDAELLVKAPLFEIPVPFNVSISEVANENPFKSNAALVAETTVPLEIVPNGVFVAPPFAPNCKVPKLIVVNPE